ncbi:MAG TPA: hypothetical protein DDZ81_04040 [Acetobacteraceae bacterium]|jgi:hypothetical protein|nr:hypothetical protein [Acetobacteraceae bacterium]
MRRCGVLLLAAAVAGCTGGLAARQAELSQWVGRSETELVAAMGAPNRFYDSGGMKFLTYEDRRTEIIPGTPYFGGFGPFGYGDGFGPYGGGFPPTATTLVCDTTFTVAGNIVQGFSLRGNACG